METIFIYVAKSGGLLILFYCAYYFLLHKETFFNSNRWFLISGLITSAILPFLIYTKTVWVDPAPISNLNLTPVYLPQANEVKNLDINWNYIFIAVYGIGFLVFLIKFVMDFYSLYTVLKGQKVQQQADFKFIDINKSIAPFSYFEYIVYNSSMYTVSELEIILEHEKVHSDQNHTIDVLISRVFCLLFWFNPVIWFYKKSITQNLEFIADREAVKKIADKRAYQYTLLKITTHESCIAITNHFYQSLIKKRIVMLNKNQSKKTNSWKYYVVIPALVTFVLLFQIEVIAREKPTLEILKATGNDIEILKINKETTDQELKEKTRILKENYDITATFSEVERNNKNELTSIRVELSKGKEIEQQMNVRGTNAIKAFGIVISKLENGKLNVGFKTEETVSVNENLEVLNSASSITEKEIFINGSKATEDEMNKLDPKEIESMDVSKNSGKAAIKITTKHLTQPVKFSNKIIFINGVKSDAEQLNQLDQNLIDNVNVNTSDNTVRITTKTNNSEVRINTQVSTTTNQQQKPIIFINGVKADPKINIEDMSQKDIVTINVFKGKAAEDKYGSEGKNGVVEIVTKHSTKNNDTSNNVIIQSKSGNPIVISSDKINIKNTEKLLIVIDGKVIENKNIEDLDPQNIEKMDVLKGTVAVKKYGDKGKNGAIEISTKK